MCTSIGLSLRFYSGLYSETLTTPNFEGTIIQDNVSINLSVRLNGHNFSQFQLMLKAVLPRIAPYYDKLYYSLALQIANAIGTTDNIYSTKNNKDYCQNAK